MTAGRPFVTWKYAATLDGLSAAPDGTSKWITSEEARRDVQVFRAEADAIVAGTGAVLADDPRLTVRDAKDLPLPFDRQPLRVVVGETKIPNYYRVFDRVAPTLLIQSRDPEVVMQEARREQHPAHLARGWPAPGRCLLERRRHRPHHRLHRPCDAGLRPSCSRGRSHDARRSTAHHDRRPDDGRSRHPHDRHAGTYAARGLRLMFTGLVEEKGTVTADRGPRRLRTHHDSRTARHLRRQARRLDRDQRLLPDRDGPGRRHVQLQTS